jgi:hypothetical protein
MNRKVVCLLIVIVLLTAVSLVLAQTGEFQLPWHRVAGGGGTSDEGGRYTLSGTIGQSEAGVLMEGSSFQLSGGYWGGASSSALPSELYLPVVIRPDSYQ